MNAIVIFLFIIATIGLLGLLYHLGRSLYKAGYENAKSEPMCRCDTCLNYYRTIFDDAKRKKWKL